MKSNQIFVQCNTQTKPHYSYRETAFQIVSYYRANFESLLLWLREFCKHMKDQQFNTFTRNDTGKIHELISKVIKIELLCNILVLNYATTKLWSQPSYQQWSHECFGGRSSNGDIFQPHNIAAILFEPFLGTGIFRLSIP